MVIGGEKSEQIDNEPLLKWYFDLFKRALYGQNRRLWIIGYGFGDRHVNEVIAEAIRDYGLRWFSISPSSRGAFIKQVRGKPHGDALLQGHRHRFVGTLAAIYPTGGGETWLARRINESLIW